LREKAQRRGIALTREIDPRLGAVNADERKVKQVLLNLLSNAVKFTPEGGRIDVRAGIVDGAYYQLAGRRSPENPDRYKVFAPRISFAYRPNASGNTVIRGGYGIFYDSAELREIDGAAGVYPYVSRGNYQQSLGQTTPLQTTDQLFPSFTGGGVATPAFNSFLAVNQSPEPRNPNVQQWSLGIQRQFRQSTTAELNYVGAHGDNLLMRINIAQALQYTPDNPTVAGRRPYPNFGTMIDSVVSSSGQRRT